MHRISQSTITAIRSDKKQGKSLKEIALRYGIAKSTVSFYCRDLFSHPARIYQTEKEARKQGTERAKHFICLTCGSPTKSKNRLCGTCYQRSRQRSIRHKKNKLYPCRECQTNFVRKPDGLCLSCYSKLLAERRTNQAKEQEQRRENRLVYLAQRDVKAKEQSRCLDSPSGAHYWFIDSDNIGNCKYCHQQKDMLTNKLKPQKRETPIPELIPLGLRERYLQAWCRITCSLIEKGLSEQKALLVCKAIIKETDRTYTTRQVAAMEKEASQCQPIPEYIHKQLQLADKEVGCQPLFNSG